MPLFRLLQHMSIPPSYRHADWTSPPHVTHVLGRTDEASMEAAAPSSSGGNTGGKSTRLLALPSMNLPITVLEQQPYPNVTMIAEGEQRLRDSMRASMGNASSAELACANKDFGPHPSADPHCFDWCGINM
jgi:hypothetical protein